MNAVVCVKVVPTRLINMETEENGGVVLNPYDVYALQKVVERKTDLDLYITCLCMGPVSAEPVLKRCYALGADKVVLVSDRLFAGADTYATSKVLSEAIKKLDYNLVFCGNVAIDGETGQVVGGVAERLSFFCMKKVERLLESKKKEWIRVKILDDDSEKIVDVKLPAVVSFSDLSMNGNISLLKLKQSKRREIIHWNADDLKMNGLDCGQKGSKTKVVSSTNKSLVNNRTPMMLEEITNETMSLLMQQIYQNL